MTYRIGEAVVVGVIFGVLVALHLAEIVCAMAGWPSLGYRVLGWSRRNRWFATALLVVVGVLLAHFFLNPEPGG